MQLHLPLNPQIKNIILFDIEYDMDNLVQIAILTLKRTNYNTFKLNRSINQYVKQPQPLNTFFTRYTGITDQFLNDNGVPLSIVQELIQELLSETGVDDTVVISHGLKNDLLVLNKNQVPLTKCKYHYCTYNKAKSLLHRKDHLTLGEIAAESGYYLFNAHNAYADVWATLNVFCYLTEVEYENT